MKKPKEMIDTWNKYYEQLYQDIEEYDVLNQSYNNLDKIYHYTKGIDTSIKNEKKQLREQNDIYNRKYYYEQVSIDTLKTIYVWILYVVSICLVIVSIMVFYSQRYKLYGFLVVCLSLYLFMIPKIPIPYIHFL